MLQLTFAPYHMSATVACERAPMVVMALVSVGIKAAILAAFFRVLLTTLREMQPDLWTIFSGRWRC